LLFGKTLLRKTLPLLTFLDTVQALRLLNPGLSRRGFE